MDIKLPFLTFNEGLTEIIVSEFSLVGKAEDEKEEMFTFSSLLLIKEKVKRDTFQGTRFYFSIICKNDEYYLNCDFTQSWLLNFHDFYDNIAKEVVLSLLNHPNFRLRMIAGGNMFPIQKMLSEKRKLHIIPESKEEQHI